MNFKVGLISTKSNLFQLAKNLLILIQFKLHRNYCYLRKKEQ